MASPRRPSTRQTRAEIESLGRIWAAFGLTLGLFLVGSHATSLRTWGFNAWGFLGTPWNWLLALVALVVGLLFARLSSTSGHSQATHADTAWTYWGLASLAVSLQVVLFIALRTQSHFLGDGYQLLSQLAGNTELARWRDFGERWIHRWIFGFIQGDGEQAARLSYAVVSIASGAAILLALSAYARVRYGRTSDGLLFAGMVGVSGSMLLAFGYVENYSLLALCIVLTLLVGLLAVQKRVPWWVVLPPTAALLVMHVLGVVFVPAALYAMGTSAGMSSTLSPRARRRRHLVLGMLILAGAVGLLYVIAYSQYARFALVPLMVGRFTIEGYTLFSAAHLADWINLLILVQPGLGVFAAALFLPGCRKALRSPDGRFLVVATASALLATFLLDPKLGMPRDWDLLSFAGWPLSILVATVILAESEARRGRALAAAFVILLGALSLGPRALILHRPEAGARMAKSYMDLDHGRSRTGLALLSKYYLERGDTLSYRQVERQRQLRYPVEAVALRAQMLLEQKNYREAYSAARQVIGMAPNVWEGWLHLGRCYQAAGLIDSALDAFEIADGLNPDYFLLQIHLGMCYAGVGQREKAEKALARAIRMDTTHAQPYAALAYVRKVQGDRDGYERLIETASTRADAEAWVFKDLGDIYAGRKEWPSAASAYGRALQLGSDSTEIMKIVRQYPELGSLVK